MPDELSLDPSSVVPGIFFLRRQNCFLSHREMLVSLHAHRAWFPVQNKELHKKNVRQIVRTSRLSLKGEKEGKMILPALRYLSIRWRRSKSSKLLNASVSPYLPLVVFE